MNIFVLSTGRCGSETFVRACEHMTNYTAAHESNNRWLHPFLAQPYRELKFPPNHIEADNRLSWFLGALEAGYGRDAYYVHLLRPREEVARSLLRRGRRSVLYGFAAGILQYYEEARTLTDQQRYEIALHYCDTVNENIKLFLRDKPKVTTMWLSDIKPAFREFWHAIGAQGDLDAALREWDVRHNVSRRDDPVGWASPEATVDPRVSTSIDELSAIIPPGSFFILADEGDWGTSRVIRGRGCFPFTEKHDQYWGPPPDAEFAVAELERLRARGASYFVLAWPAFWYREAYPSFMEHLQSGHACILENDRMAVYELSAPT